MFDCSMDFMSYFRGLTLENPQIHRTILPRLDSCESKNYSSLRGDKVAEAIQKIKKERFMKKQQNNLANPANPNFTNFLALGFIFMIIFDLAYALMRVFMVRSNIDGANFLSSDFASMFIMGARLDMRVVCIFAALVVLLGYATSLFSALAGHLNATRERERERE